MTCPTLRWIAPTSLLVGCGAPPAAATDPASPPADVVFRGACDASGAVPLGDRRFAVADDEDDVLRVYDGRVGGDPLVATDVSASIGLPSTKKKAPDADLEAAARLGDTAFWMSSHGLNRDGDLDSRRAAVFATTTPDDGVGLVTVGTTYHGLLADLAADPTLAAFGLERASLVAPKLAGGLNIEGLTRHADGTSLWVGFRNPRPEDKALLIPLRNPLDVIAGGPARFGPPALLPLDGLGIRALAYAGDRYLIAAGAVDEEAPSKLFVWSGSGDPVGVEVDLRGFNPEAIVTWEGETRILVLSDDGGREIDGEACKKLDDASKKQFRGRWLAVP